MKMPIGILFNFCRIKRINVDNSRTALQLFNKAFQPEQIELYESFYIAGLDHNENLLGIKRLGAGNSRRVTINLRDIHEFVRKTKSLSIYMAHNHPSGICFPSKCDIELTNKVKTYCEEVGIKLKDHIILSKRNYLSFRSCDLI